MPASYFHRLYLAIAISALFANLSFAQITGWQIDPSGYTQYQVPRGWEVGASQEQGVYMWQAKEDPTNSLGADITVLSMPDFPNSSPTYFIDQLRNTVQDFKLSATKQISADEVHYLATGRMEGKEVSSNLIFLRDRNTQFLYLASFSAATRNYTQLGGAVVLYQSLQRQNPFASQGPSSPSSAPAVSSNVETWNMQSLEIQNFLKRQGIIPKKENLLGKWLQGFSYQTGTATQEIVSGQITYGERGYGHLFTFNADNTYNLTYKYNSVSQGCKYQADFFEQGRFELKGRQLKLEPTQYSGNYNICNKISPENNSNPPARYFDLYVDQQGKRLLIIGQPFEYSASTETDVSGRAYIQEGFNKTQ